MKKGKVLVALVLAILLGVVMKYTVFTIKGNEDLEGITLTANELDFFNKMTNKELYKDRGIMVVDTINGTYNETIVVDGIHYEKEALSFLFYKTIIEDRAISIIVDDSLEISSNDKIKLQQFYLSSKTRTLTKKEIEDFLFEEDFAQHNIGVFNRILYEKVGVYNPNDSLYLNTTFLYETVYVGNYQTYNEFRTDIGIYTIQAEYYMNNGNKIYTGATKYILHARFDSYYHIEKYMFLYQSDILSPSADITVILDFWGEEKMILSSDSFPTDYKITREQHYNRNQYNTINGIPADTVYPTKKDLDGALWSKSTGVYFHQLMPNNNQNVKYVKETKYYDVHLGVELYGELELVYRLDGHVVYDNLVTFTFNFGVLKSYSEFMLSKSHWIRDIYPYLIWGNAEGDYKYYTAFERFIWNKYSTNKYKPTKYRNTYGEDLINLYTSGEIGDALGTPIPDIIQNNQARWDLRFDEIPTQNIVVNEYTSRNWATLITGAYSSVPGYIHKIEIYDEVEYNKKGTYKVKVGIRDAVNRLRSQEFKVIVSVC